MEVLLRIADVFLNLPHNHLIHASLTLLAVLLLLWVTARMNTATTIYFDRFIGFLPLIIEINFQIQLFVRHEWLLAEALPLEISYLTSLGIVYYLYHSSRNLKAWLFYIGIWSAAAALLNTIMTGNESWYFRLRYYGHHGVLLYFGIRIYINGYRPTLNDYMITARIMLFFLCCIGIINQLLDSNYMFTRSRPTGMNLSMLMPPWPFYFLITVSIGLVFCALLYLLAREDSITTHHK